MELALVDMGNHPALCQNPLEMALEEVGDADGAALSRLVELFHGAPRPPQALGWVGRGVGALGPVQQVQVDVVSFQSEAGVGGKIMSALFYEKSINMAIVRWMIKLLDKFIF